MPSRVDDIKMKTEGLAYHFNLHECFITVIEQILCFSAVNANDTQEELATHSQGHYFTVLVDDGNCKDVRRQTARRRA